MLNLPTIKPEEKEAFTKASLKMLYQMEVLNPAIQLDSGALVNNPILNNMVLNFLVPFKAVKDAELVIVDDPKSLIIYLKLNYLGWFKFIRRRIATHISENLQELLPNFAVGIITNRKVFEKKLEEIKKKKAEKVSLFKVVEK